MTDRIELLGLHVFAHHGVLAHEQREGQEFVVDLVLEVDLAPAGMSDELADTVDYGRLTADVHDLVAHGTRRDLIEAVAEDVARHVLADTRIRAVEVTLHKPHAPVTVAMADVAVRIRRQRPAG